MRCTATVTGHSVDIRSWRDPDQTPQCRRQAVTEGLCSQHAQVVERERERLRADHRRIVNRILEIPPRA